MFIWKNFLKIFCCLFTDVLIFVILIFNNKQSHKYDQETKNIFILLNIIIISIIGILTFVLLYFNPFYINSVPIFDVCVACLDSGKISGIKCKYCNNTPLCDECYLKWIKKSDTCPLCRGFYLV